jgi:hypothetical protein
VPIAFHGGCEVSGLLLLVFLPECQAPPMVGFMPTDSTTVGEITVAAVADFQLAFTDIAKLYEEQIYGRAAQSGESIRFENYSTALKLK